MRNSIRTIAAAALATGSLALAACGGMGSGSEEMYDEFLSSCQSSFTQSGGPANMAEPYCNCALDEVKEQDLGPLEMMDEETIMPIAEECAKKTMEDLGLG